MSKQAKHTPGPWRIGAEAMSAIEIEAGGEEIACVYASNGLDEPTLFPMQANARLIAAAPELLEAVCRWISWCDNWHAGKPHPIDDLNFARAAAAKAEGRS